MEGDAQHTRVVAGKFVLGSSGLDSWVGLAAWWQHGIALMRYPGVQFDLFDPVYIYSCFSPLIGSVILALCTSVLSRAEFTVSVSTKALTSLRSFSWGSRTISLPSPLFSILATTWRRKTSSVVSVAAKVYINDASSILYHLEAQPTMRTILTIAVLLGAILYGASEALQRAEPLNFIFAPEKLHILSQQCVQTYGNDTKAMVATIVDQLRQDDKLAPYLSTSEEWIFNNAGGAMGAMYLIHASTSYSSKLSLISVLMMSCRHHGIPHRLRHSHRN